MYHKLPLILFATLLGYGLWRSPEFGAIAAGVAIFLMGMLSLESGFSTFSGSTLERFLRHSTDRMWKSLLFGFSATTLMQSSSLVTLISISFLSAGLLGLSQGIGVIFGANLGSTTGAWLVAGFGLNVNLAAWAMPVLIFGVLFQFAGGSALKGLGKVLAGLGLLLLGIHYMKEGFETFGQHIDLAAYAVPGLKGLLVFTLIGIAATVLMQSSHATLVLTITALAAQQITYDNALALSIGANVGTTITAMLGAIGANVQGRRLAAAHVIFNVSTGLLALALIGPLVLTVEHVSAWMGIAADNHTLKLALFHTLFNLIGIALMLPLTGALVRGLERLIAEKIDSTPKTHFINPAMLNAPEAAIEATRRELLALFENVSEVMVRGLGAAPQVLERPSGNTSAIPLGQPVDIDPLYRQRIKPLYGELLDFLARVQSSETHAHSVFTLRRAGQRLIEALKDLKHMQKNMQRFINSSAPQPREQYREIRSNLLSLLQTLYQLSRDDSDAEARLEALRQRAESFNRMAGDELDNLIRERRLNTETASSLMNDQAYAHDIALNLIEMVETILKPLPKQTEGVEGVPTELTDNGETGHAEARHQTEAELAR